MLVTTAQLSFLHLHSLNPSQGMVPPAVSNLLTLMNIVKISPHWCAQGAALHLTLDSQVDNTNHHPSISSKTRHAQGDPRFNLQVILPAVRTCFRNSSEASDLGTTSHFRTCVPVSVFLSYFLERLFNHNPILPFCVHFWSPHSLPRASLTEHWHSTSSARTASSFPRPQILAAPFPPL